MYTAWRIDRGCLRMLEHAKPSLRPRPQYYMGLRIAGDNLVRWRFDNVEINYLNLSLTCILKLNFVADVLREKFETMPSLPKTTEKLNTA